MVRTSWDGIDENGDRSGDLGRWVAIAWSTDPDPARAARWAVEEALCHRDAKLAVALCGAGRDPDRVAAGLAEGADAVPLIGCSTEAVLTPEGPLPDAIAVMAIGGGGISVATSAERIGPDGPRAAGAEAAGCHTRVNNRRYRTLLLLTDGYVREQERILSGVYSVVGASIPLIGGSASPAVDGAPTFQFHGQTVLSGAVVAAAIGSDAPLGLGLRHGWRRTGEPLVVTHSDQGVVKTLNDQPALLAYLRRHDAPQEAYEDPRVFEDFAGRRPIGVSRRAGEDLRDVSSSQYLREGWLYSTAEIPEGGLVWTMESDDGSVLGAARDAGASAQAALGGAPALGMLAFDCYSRRDLLGEEGTRREVKSLAEFGVPFIGMYTWGEIARTQGINAYHNLTLAVLALG